MHLYQLCSKAKLDPYIDDQRYTPFKLMASPDGGLVSPVSDAALITALSNFAGEDVKVRLICSPDDTWQALESLAHDAANGLIPIFTEFPLKIF